MGRRASRWKTLLGAPATGTIASYAGGPATGCRRALAWREPTSGIGLGRRW